MAEKSEDATIKKVSVWADSWWKILSILFTIIFAIYQLSVVWVTIAETKAELKEFKENVAKDNAFRDERSDKRYDNATLMYNDLKSHGLQLQIELTTHKIEEAYHRGWVDATLKK